MLYSGPTGIDNRGGCVCLLSEPTIRSTVVGPLRVFRSERDEARKRRKTRPASGADCPALRDRAVQTIQDLFQGGN